MVECEFQSSGAFVRERTMENFSRLFLGSFTLLIAVHWQ
jgi:hypothetical protein